MDDCKGVGLLEEAFQILEQEILLISKTKQRGQLRLIRRQMVIARNIKQGRSCAGIGFSDFFRQSVFLIVKLISELLKNHRS